jgi:flavodoxin
MTKKILVAYFSHSGNTREVANQIQKIAGGDIFEIQAVKQYPNNYEAVKEVAQWEHNDDSRTELATKIENMGSYDVVFIGYPIWWGTFPAPVKSFLSEYDLAGKTIASFCTNEGSGLGDSVADISRLCPKSMVLDGLAVRGSNSKNSQSKVFEWLRKSKLDKETHQ